MKNYAKILFSILVAGICATTFAADKQNCVQKTGKDCPKNVKKCNCGKKCDC